MSDSIVKSGSSNALLAPTRREMLKYGGAALATAAFSGPLLSTKAHAEEPKKGGTLRLGLEGGTASDSFDPTTYNDSIPIFLSLTMMNGLVEYDEAGNPAGELLESWETKNGASEWTFNVRQGITFSNGKKLDADDIIYSIQLHRAEKSKSAAKGQLATVTEIKALSPSQVYIKLSEGNADFPVILGDYHLVVVPNGHTDWTKPIGTGAYVLDAFEPGVRVSFKARGEYWKPGRGNFDAVEVRYISDPAARTAALQAGEIDVANRLDPRTVKLLMRVPTIKVVQTKGTGFRYVFVARCNDVPTKSNDLRLALKYGIDREQICKTVYNGFASPGFDHLLDPANPFFNTKLKPHTYDPEKAMFHFKKAGLSPSEAIKLDVSEGAFGTSIDAAQLYQQSMKKAGLSLNVNKVPADGYWTNTWLKSPFCAVIWARRMSADQTLSTCYGLKSDYNDSDWRDEKFDKMLSEARVMLDPAKRKEIYDECQSMVAENAGHVVFAISDFLDGYSAKVKGVKPHPRFDLDDCRVAEKAWFA